MMKPDARRQNKAPPPSGWHFSCFIVISNDGCFIFFPLFPLAEKGRRVVKKSIRLAARPRRTPSGTEAGQKRDKEVYKSNRSSKIKKINIIKKYSEIAPNPPSRGQTRKLACLGIHSQNSQLSFKLIADPCPLPTEPAKRLCAFFLLAEVFHNHYNSFNSFTNPHKEEPAA
jgi:hypothetical protein